MNDDLARLIINAAIGTLCVVVLTAFLLVVAYGLAHLTVHLMDHIDHEIRRDQATVRLQLGELGGAGPMVRNVIDVTTPARQLGQLQLLPTASSSWAQLTVPA